MLRPVTRYLLAHWRGQQGLAWSFWVNFVALRGALFAAQTLLIGESDKDYTQWSAAIWTYMILGHGIAFVWQAVGVLRAAETWLKETGSQASVWGAQLSLVVGLFLTFSFCMEAWQATYFVPEAESHLTRMEREHASKYTLSLTADKGVMNLDGFIELGISKSARKFLMDHPEIRLVVLNSSGGNIFEARGLAKLFSERSVATRVDMVCSSACTAAYIGGKTRSMKPGAKFGFHQYRVDADYTILSADPAREQARDIELFKSRGVSEDFLGRVFSRPSSEMWYPEAGELLAAGFVHLIEE